jgi:indolepyruvate ferredoxin oxidoreductase alpha subunit
MSDNRLLLSGNEAVAQAALDAGVRLGAGYPGTPSTEILEHFSQIGGNARWSPNEKVALEVGIGSAFAGARTLVTMKHVGVNVAADPLFTAAYTDLDGALVVVSADDPGMASSQNEQDNRRYAVAAGVPMLEPADSQEAYDFLRLAIDLSEHHRCPVILRVTTRICHSKTIVHRSPAGGAPGEPTYARDLPARVMIPAYARGAHRKLRAKLDEIARWGETAGAVVELPGQADRASLGLVSSGVASVHAREACPEAPMLKLGLTHPLPLERIRRFAEGVDDLLVIEEGDPYLVEQLRMAGIACRGKDEMYRFGELTVERVRRIVSGDASPEAVPPKGKPPELCKGCPHRNVFEALRDAGCIVTGDIGCYTLGVLPPFEAMDTCVCMGASIGVGLGLRAVLPPEQARKVVSVIGDSTFVHSGITGLVEMAYNRPRTGHVVVILDNGTTAMTGLQEHPGTGRLLDHQPAAKLSFEDLARAIGVENVQTIDMARESERFAVELDKALTGEGLSLIIARRPCLLAAKRIREYDKAHQAAGE